MKGIGLSDKYFKYIYYNGPEDHTGRTYVDYTILNPNFIGPLNLMEAMENELSQILSEQIKFEIDKEILNSISTTYK